VSWRVGSVQPKDIQGDISATIDIITGYMNRADREQVDILCFPECFLQGYTLDTAETKARALSLKSPQFVDILTQLSKPKVAIVLGVIEEDGGAYFNTAVIAKQGELIGKYRKVNLFEKNFQSGTEHPVFMVDGLTLGINICYDARFPEGATEMASKGAKVIFYPLNNRLSKEKAIKYREKHLPNLVERAKETNSWIVSSDVIAFNDNFIGYGCTAVVDPNGTTVERVPELKEGIVGFDLPL
jgi:predicted amidohydrolase